MARNNPSNPFTRESEHTAKDIQMPISKARVTSVRPYEDGGRHSVRVQIYGSNSSKIAPVLTPVAGSVWVPKQGDDVAVLFSKEGKPWVIGSWYATDRLEDGNITLPEYEEGDIRLGNESGSHLTIKNDGTVILSSTNSSIKFDGRHRLISYNSTEQTFSNSNDYYVVEYDSVISSGAGEFDTDTHSYTIKSDGYYTINAEVEFPNPGQNIGLIDDASTTNKFTIAIFIDGVERKSNIKYPLVDDELKVGVEYTDAILEGAEIDIRLKHNSGEDKTINASRTSNFTIVEQ